MSPGHRVLLEENLRELKLSVMARNLDVHVRQARENQLNYEEFLVNLTDYELQIRKENRLKRRLKEAKFPLMKPLETFDLDATPDLDGRLIKELASGDYIESARNVILLGRSGTGNYVKLYIRGKRILPQDLESPLAMRENGYGSSPVAALSTNWWKPGKKKSSAGLSNDMSVMIC